MFSTVIVVLSVQISINAFFGRSLVVPSSSYIVTPETLHSILWKYCAGLLGLIFLFLVVKLSCIYINDFEDHFLEVYTGRN